MFSDSKAFTQSLGLGSQLSQGSPAKKARTEEAQVCLPATARMLHDAVASPDVNGAYLSDGRDGSMLVVVGMVEGLTASTATIEFTMAMGPAMDTVRPQLAAAGVLEQIEPLLMQSADSGNKIKVRKYITDASKAGVMPANGQFVVVTGLMRSSPELHLSATFMHIVEDAKRISFHMLEAAHSLLRVTRGSPAKDLRPVASPQAAFSSPPKQLAAAREPLAQAQASPHSSVGHAGDQAAASMSSLRESVLAALRASAAAGSVEGLTVADLLQKIPGATEADTQKLLAALKDEGDVYNTMDDDHFGTF